MWAHTVWLHFTSPCEAPALDIMQQNYKRTKVKWNMKISISEECSLFSLRITMQTNHEINVNARRLLSFLLFVIYLFILFVVRFSIYGWTNILFGVRVHCTLLVFLTAVWSENLPINCVPWNENNATWTLNKTWWQQINNSQGKWNAIHNTHKCKHLESRLRKFSLHT